MSTRETPTSDPDPLSALLMDGAEIDRARIAAAIGELIGIDKATKSVRPRGPAYRTLTNREKLLATLLGLKAATLMGIREGEAVRSGELPAMTGVAEGSVPPTLKDLREGHLVSQTKEGAYYLSDADVLAAVEVLENRGAGSTAVGATKSSGRARRKSKKGAPAPSPSHGDANGAPTSSKSGSGFSQTEKVREMIANGWFDESRTLVEVQREIRHSTAHQIPLGNLSPVFVRLVRSGELTRGLDDEGNYEYQAK